MKLDNRLVVIGGFGAAQGALERVAHAMHGLGEATGDAEVLTFRRAVNYPEAVQKAGRRAARIITHSAGIVALGEVPEEGQAVTAFNGPDGSKHWWLVITGAIEGRRMVSRIADTYGRISAVGALFSAVGSFPDDIRRLDQISRTSTADTLAAYRAAGVAVDAVVTMQDLIFPPRDLSPYGQAGVPVVSLEGDHNELLVCPEAVLSAWQAKRLQPVAGHADARPTD